MTAKRKQEILSASGIFVALCSIGFSFEEGTYSWFWQNNPWFAILLLSFAFSATWYWLQLELEKQREFIKAEYQRNHADTTEQAKIANQFSLREMEVLQLITGRLTNKEIAAKLFISLPTVKTHINNIYRILEVKNRREAIEKMKPRTNQ